MVIFFQEILLYKGPRHLNSDNINLENIYNFFEKVMKRYNMKCILSSHYDPIILIDYLKDIYKFISNLKNKKGSGLHKMPEYKIYL